MLPLLLNEEVVQFFKYWHNGIRHGMRYRNRIYGKIRSYPLQENLKAFDFANAIAQSNVFCCITCNKDHYVIWVCLTLISQVQGSSETTISQIQHSAETLMSKRYEVGNKSVQYQT